MHITCLARVAAAAVLALAPAVQMARADEPSPRANRSAAPSGSVVLEAGVGRVFRTGGTISSIFAADPKVVEGTAGEPQQCLHLRRGPRTDLCRRPR